MELLLVVFTLGYLMQHVANGILLRKIWKQKTIEGLSSHTQIIFLVATLVRGIWICDTRLMYLAIVWVEWLVSGLTLLFILYLFYKYKDTLYNHVKTPFDYRIILAVCAVLCIFFHPGGKGKYFFTVQMLVSFTMFAEACGLLPQIYTIRKLRECEIMTGRYLVCLAVSRIFRLTFWVMLYLQGDTFLYLIIADLLHTALLADFIYYYLQNKNSKVILLY